MNDLTNPPKPVPLSEWTDVQLEWKLVQLNDQLKDLEETRKNPKFLAKFKNQPLPPINPAFLKLKADVEAEIQKRQGG